ncbi:MAG TPA: hypothetical protein VGB82_29200 [Alphaproteobacteria bacterium]
MTADNTRTAKRKSKASERRDRDPAGATPPLPKNSRREGIPREGALPHDEEAARPKDSGRHGA